MLLSKSIRLNNQQKQIKPSFSQILANNTFIDIKDKDKQFDFLKKKKIIK